MIIEIYKHYVRQVADGSIVWWFNGWSWRMESTLEDV